MMGSNSLRDVPRDGDAECPFYEHKLFSSGCTLDFLGGYIPKEYQTGESCFHCKFENYESSCPRFVAFRKKMIETALQLEKTLKKNPSNEFKQYTCPYLKKRGFINTEYVCSVHNDESPNAIRSNLYCESFWTELEKSSVLGESGPGCLNAFTQCEYFKQARESGHKSGDESLPCQYYDSMDKTCLLQEKVELPSSYIKKYCCCDENGVGKRKCIHFQKNLNSKIKRRHSSLERFFE